MTLLLEYKILKLNLVLLTTDVILLQSLLLQ